MYVRYDQFKGVILGVWGGALAIPLTLALRKFPGTLRKEGLLAKAPT